MNNHLVSPVRSTLLLGAAAAAALLLASPSLAHAQTLLSVDDIAYMNSPYTFSISATYRGVVVGVLGTGVLNHSAGTLTDTNTLLVGKSGSTGTYNLSGTGVLSLTDPNFDEHIGDGGTGFFNQSGGAHTVSNTEYIGYAGTGTYTQSGGTHTINSFLTLGNGSGTYILTAGTLSAGNENLGRDAGTGTFTQSGGTNTISGTLEIGRLNDSNPPTAPPQHL